ncbi:hypothetical protein DLAC_00640 [Tieghemostelium lacteum]|uniref:Short-chain dehydrogenase/reductase (SDR) family protein n=1 Tax=Tieghemostelium lacteum TaxID=361077 RepID=A0A152AA95_TIELA|nr:hypothetical protein DLAC_00640 [Tieghemostelium lacteum]|eukprot:KYR03140.1 hypothetical protein DLAC_00640 [Tieghemostelium lacteum]
MFTFNKDIDYDKYDLKDKTVIITGSNAGLGKEICRKIAKCNAGRIIMASRNEAKAKEAIKEISEQTGNDCIEFMKLDLLSLESVSNFAISFKSKNIPCHLLINNAGIMWLWENKTYNPPLTMIGTQQFNTQFLANYLGHFLLTHLLFDLLMESSARILNISSCVHFLSGFDLKNLTNSHSYTFSQYCQSKLAQILSTYSWVKKIQDSPSPTKATMVAIDPGIFASEIVSLPWPLTHLYHLVFKTPEYCSRPIVKVAIDSEFENVTGKYIDSAKICNSSKTTYDQELADQLWEQSMELIKDYII